MSEPAGAALAGERLDRAVALLWGCSRATAASLVADGAVRLNGAVVTRRSLRLGAGDELALVPEALAQRRRAAPARPEPDSALAVVYDDAHLVVVNKPAGMVVHPGAGHDSATLAGALLARYPEMAGVGDPTRPGIVHRLDAGTTGLLVAARSVAAYESLVGQLAARGVRRGYDALCWGEVRPERGVIDAPVGRSGRRPTQMTVTERGRPARTGYEVTAHYRSPVPVSRLTCRLETGRTHQIRVHLSAIGHPVVGDAVYGARPAAAGGWPGGFARPALHAAALGFRHPDGGREMSFEAPLPADMAGLVAELA